MAFGFARLPGRSRQYVNVSNTDAPVPIGETLSRRQYDRYIERLGQRTHLPGTTAIRDAERRLEALRQALLDQRENLLDQREADIAAREAALAEAERELQARQSAFGNSAQARGQRRYNAALDAYVDERRRQGRPISKRDARSTPEFREIMKDIKGRPNKRGLGSVRDADAAKRRAAFDKLGGGITFKEFYQRLYPQRAPAAPGTRVYTGTNRSGRSTFTVRRGVSRG